MTSSFVPKEEIASYQRWEMKSFDVVDLSTPSKVAEEALVSDDSATISPSISYPSEEELAIIFAQAKDQGYSAGYEEGSVKGYEAGRAEGYAEGRSLAEKEVKQEVAQMQMLLTNFSQNLNEMSEVVAGDLLELAITMSRKMLTQAFTMEPELIVPIVREAISQLPYSAHHPKLYLHPDDAKIIHAHLHDELIKEHWSIREDDQVTRGGCRIVTESSEINSTVEMRWQKILSAMGQQNNWVE